MPDAPHVVCRPLHDGGWRGTLYRDGVEWWCCDHIHQDSYLAERCARQALKKGWGDARAS